MAWEEELRLSDSFTKACEYIFYAVWIGENYRETKKKMKPDLLSGVLSRPDNVNPYSVLRAEAIDRLLPQLDRKTQEFIRKEFLEESPKNWYRGQFSTSTYYRRKAKAAEQFVHCLDL